MRPGDEGHLVIVLKRTYPITPRDGARPKMMNRISPSSQTTVYREQTNPFEMQCSEQRDVTEVALQALGQLG